MDMRMIILDYMGVNGNGRANNLPTDRELGIPTMKRIKIKDLNKIQLYARRVAVKLKRTIRMSDDDGLWIFKKDGKVFVKGECNGRV